MKSYHEKVIDEIIEMIKNNLLLLYNYQDDTLITIRGYCLKHNYDKYKPLRTLDLIWFTDEALSELINTDFLYDLRDIV